VGVTEGVATGCGGDRGAAALGDAGRVFVFRRGVCAKWAVAHSKSVNDRLMVENLIKCFTTQNSVRKLIIRELELEHKYANGAALQKQRHWKRWNFET